MYKNSEGFRDPTAGAAISHAMKEFREKRKAAWEHETAVKERKKVYIVSKYAGDIEQNKQDAICFCRAAIKAGFIPVASHLLYPQILNDSDAEERELGLLFGQALLAVCDEVWVFAFIDAKGEYILSPGMKEELREARRLKKMVRFIDGKEFR